MSWKTQAFFSIFIHVELSILKKKGKQRSRKFQYLIQAWVCAPMNMHERSLGEFIQNCHRRSWVADLHRLFGMNVSIAQASLKHVAKDDLEL